MQVHAKNRPQISAKVLRRQQRWVSARRFRRSRLLTAATSMVLDKERENEAATVHKLKLQWVITADESEKSRISSELRRRLHNAQSK